MSSLIIVPAVFLLLERTKEASKRNLFHSNLVRDVQRNMMKRHWSGY